MLKGRLWRFLMFFLALYLIFLLTFYRSFNSETTKVTTTTSPLPHAIIKELDLQDEQKKIPDDIKVENKVSNLEPVMTKGVLGNYEPKQLSKSSGPGEDGEGVQLQGDEEKKLGDKSVADYGFNEVASDKISLNRRARDTR